MTKFVHCIFFILVSIISHYEAIKIGEGRPVLPLIPIGGTFNGPRGHGGKGEAEGGAAGGTRSGTFLQSSGTSRPCTNNADCYPYREPNEWCPMPAGLTYVEKGCWCDHSVKSCVVDRSDNSWAFCSEKASSQCGAGHGGGGAPAPASPSGGGGEAPAPPTVPPIPTTPSRLA